MPKGAVRHLTFKGKRAFLALSMVKCLLVALGSELAFVIGLFIGSIVSGLVTLLVHAIRGFWRLSAVRALVQGAVCGLFAGAACLWVAVELGRTWSVPDGRLLCLAIVPPIVGEFGHFLNRFSLRHRGKPDTGFFVPLGRLHAAAWEPIRQGIFRIALEVFKENAPEDISVFAARKAIWFVGWMCWGLTLGAIISIWWLARDLHVSAP